MQPAASTNQRTWQLNRQAFILRHWPSGQGNTSATVQLFDARERLDTYASAYLALALHQLDPGDTSRPPPCCPISTTPPSCQPPARIGKNRRDWRNMNTDTRSTAIVLETLVTIDPGNNLIPNVVRWLMVAREGHRLETTQETAWALIRPDRLAGVPGRAEAHYYYGVNLNGQSLASGSATAANLQKPVQLHVAVADLLKDEANRLMVSRGAGDGRLYYTANLNVYQSVAAGARD